MSRPILEVENLSKAYKLATLSTRSFRDDFANWFTRKQVVTPPTLTHNQRHEGETYWALRNLTFSVQKGEILGIVGGNGAGKSTLLKLLSRITAPTEGEIHMDGRIASMLEVGTGFHPELTGKENIYLNGTILGMSHSEIRSKEASIIEFAEVSEFLNTPVKHYSSGMYVRLAFAVAAHLNPEILIIDEVLAVGDSKFQQKCLAKIKSIQHSGSTIIFVSHNLEMVRQLCTQAILLEGGQLTLHDSASKVVEYYYNHGATKSNERTIEFKDYTVGWEHSGQLLLNKIKLCNAASLNCQVYLNTPIQLELELHATSELQNIRLAYAISKQDLKLSGGHTGLNLFSLSRGVHKFRMTISNPFRAGLYRLSLGASSATDQSCMFHIDDALTIEVLPTTKDGIMQIPNGGTVTTELDCLPLT